jgi:hypothetical protein
MTPRTGLVLVRQAGSAAALMPALQGLLDSGPTAKIIIIAFPQAVATCREVADDLGKFSFHAVQTESEAHEIFEKEIGGAAFLLTGTSSAAAADAFYWEDARQRGVVSVAFLDQGSNIEKRFSGRSRNDWPDILAVIDEYDMKLAEALAPVGVQIRDTGSPALKRIKRNVEELRANGVRSNAARIVFATEPVEDCGEYREINGFVDEDSFEVAIGLIRVHHPTALLVMRLHPRDSRERWLARLPADIPTEWDIDTRAACLARAGRVFGMRSFFLLEALACGVKVISIQPGRKTNCPLTDGRMPVITNPDEYRP